MKTFRQFARYNAQRREGTEDFEAVCISCVYNGPTCPPGQQDTRMSPVASAGDRFSTCIIQGKGSFG